MPERSGQKWKNVVRGNPGDVWTNGTDKVLYQWHCVFANSCGRCIEMANCIGPWWPLPLHHGCTCKNVPIRPGTSAAAFLDYREEVRKLDRAQQRRVIGRANWRLVEAGKVEWADIVQRGRIKTLEEVVSERRLAVRDLTDVGVPEGIARRAWERVNTPEHRLVDEERRRLVERLKAQGLTAGEIRQRAAGALAGRVGIGGGPSGPQTPPRVPPAPPPPGPVAPVAPPGPPKPVGSLANFVVRGPAPAAKPTAPSGPIAMPAGKIDWESKGWKDAIREVEENGGREILARVERIARKVKARTEEIERRETGSRQRIKLNELEHKAAMAVARAIAPPGKPWKIRRNDAAAVSTLSASGGGFKEPGSYLRRQIATAEEFTGAIFEADGRPPDLAIGYGQTTGGAFRAYHYGTGQFGSISLGFEASTATVVHEIGHAVEMQTPGLTRAAEAFRLYRVAGETPTKLKDAFPDHGFGESERGAKDEFGRVWDGVQAYYAGKGYGGNATELVSMGIERLYQDAGSIARDPELFYFLVGALRGKW